MLDWLHATHAEAAARRRDRRPLHPVRPGADPGAGGPDQEPDRHGGRARRGRPAGGDQPDAGGRARLGRDPEVPALSVVAGPGRGRGDGHLAAGDGLRLDDGQAADQALGGRVQDGARRGARLRRRHRPPGGGAARHDRRRRGRVRRAVRVDRGLRWPDHPDGVPGVDRVRQEPRRLREGLRPHPEPGARARHRALAGRDVRSRPGRLLGLARPRSPGRDTAGHRQRVRGQDRRREDLAAGPGARDRDAEAVSRLGADVHRRRLRLSDDDPRRWPAALRRAARHLRRHRAGRGGRAQGAGPGRHGDLRRRSWRPR